MHYIIITSDNYLTLEMEVNKRLSNYQPIGGLSISDGYYYQALLSRSD